VLLHQLPQLPVLVLRQLPHLVQADILRRDVAGVHLPASASADAGRLASSACARPRRSADSFG